MSETKKIRAAVVGYGNIGRYTIEALSAAPDFEIAGVVRRDPTQIPHELEPYRIVGSIQELGQVDVADASGGADRPRAASPRDQYRR